jgi:hypothetical protein
MPANNQGNNRCADWNKLIKTNRAKCDLHTAKKKKLKTKQQQEMKKNIKKKSWNKQSKEKLINNFSQRWPNKKNFDWHKKINK